MSTRRRPSRCAARRVPTQRRGFSLVEIIVAVVLLSTVVLGFAAFMQRFTHSTSLNSQRSTASDLAVERVEAVKALSDYPSIDAMAVREATIAGYAGFVRQTYVRRTLSTIADHKTITVVVSNAALGDSVVKSTVITAF